MTAVAEIGHNLPPARDWLYAVLHSGEVTRVAQHLALVIFHIVDETGRASASVRDLERITGWSKATIADHLGELKVFMQVKLGVGRGKSEFDLQCKISRAVNELRCVRELDANGMAIVHVPDTTPKLLVHQPDTTDEVSVHEADAICVQEPDASVVSAVASYQPDAKSRPSRARIESSLREDTSTLEIVEVKEDGGACAPSPCDAQLAFEAYNELAQRAGLPLARTLTPQRRKSMIARMREHGGLPAWHLALANIERSAFLRGNNDRGWTAHLDFLLQASSFTKIVEGTYGNGAHAKPKESSLSKIDRMVDAALVNLTSDHQRRLT